MEPQPDRYGLESHPERLRRSIQRIEHDQALRSHTKRFCQGQAVMEMVQIYPRRPVASSAAVVGTVEAQCAFLS